MGRSDGNDIKENPFTIINTNARSLTPKISSFIDCFKELDASVAVVTETWLADGPSLAEDVDDLLHGTGIALLTRNREPAVNGVCHGGVAIAYRAANVTLKKLDLSNENRHEVLVATGAVSGHSRKLVVIAAYMPPGDTAQRSRSCLEYITDIIVNMKRRYSEPLIVLSGDFNQWRVQDAVEDFSDLAEVRVGATRGSREIDRTFVNFSRSVVTSGTLPPLETEKDDGGTCSRSDHLVAYVTTELRKLNTFEWLTYRYRFYNDESVEKFRRWIAFADWGPVLEATGSNQKAAAYQEIVNGAVEQFFPLITTRRKSTDLPWINAAIRRKIRQRKAIFRQGGRCSRWRRLKARTDEMIADRREKYFANQKIYILAEDAARVFFKNVRRYKSADKPEVFDVRSLCPGEPDEVVAEKLAEFFNKISMEFTPLEPDQVPHTFARQLPALEVWQVAGRLKHFRKPKSMVRGDIFPKLVTLFADQLALPLTNIYNEITATFIWPKIWKHEFVTVIPKTSIPEGFGDLRNISCTMLASKVYKSYVLGWAMDEVKPKANQYGGVKGCGTPHMLVGLWQDICSNLEDYRAATVMTSIDYAKAFNRLSFQHCLSAFAKKGASTDVIRLIATFLSNRTMSVRVGTTWSEPREVHGGCPQGSILGVFLFNTTTDDLEDEFLRSEQNVEDDPVIPGPEVPEAGHAEEDRPGEPDEEEGSAWEPSATSSPVTAADELVAGRDYVFLPTARNVERHLRRAATVAMTSPPHEHHPRTQAAWKRRRVRCYKYVDDGITTEKVNFENADEGLAHDDDQGGTGGDPVRLRLKRAVPSENAFRSTCANAVAKGMKVNTLKTNLLCVGDALSYSPVAYIEDEDGTRLTPTPGGRLKVLGFHFSDRPTVRAHVEVIKKKVRQRLWTLYNLKKNGFSDEELVQVYKTMIRPVADYCDVVYHPLLSDDLDEDLERLQDRALRCIYGTKISGRKMREKAGIETLRARRVAHCDNFAQKCLDNPRFRAWFPLRRARATRVSAREKYMEFFARCERLRASPLYFFRRRLNGKEGKKYGERYREYRE